MITILLNGEQKKLNTGLNLDRLLHELNMVSSGIAIAINGEIIPRSLFKEKSIGEGDQVEIIHPVGGG